MYLSNCTGTKVQSKFIKVQVFVLVLTVLVLFQSLVALMSKMNETNILIRGDIETLFPGVTFINIWPFMLLPNGQPNPDLFGPDHEHMNSIGYAIWTKAVTTYLASI